MVRVKVCIIYDTKRGSTRQIVEWMANALKDYDVKVFHISEVSSLNYCDLIILGAPVYYEKPLESFLKFLEDHSSWFEGKLVAVFIVCTVPRFLLVYARKHYLKPVLERVKGKVIDTLIVRGWFTKPPKGVKEEVEEWAKKVIHKTLIASSGT